MIIPLRGVRMNGSPLDQLTFEQALAELEQIVHQLEDGETSLEESLARYEAGIHLVKRCLQQLAQAEQRIQLLAGQDEEGKPVLEVFEHAATGNADRSESRRSRNADKADKLF
jgi:exodeoxyribonuclease VII small subunit